MSASADTSFFPPLRGCLNAGRWGNHSLALATYCICKTALTTAVPVTLADVELFDQLALNDYPALIQPDLEMIMDLAVRDKAAQDVRVIQNRLTQK